ncbi:MAG TPA: hypothetical protein P5268_08380 [Candidatus Marinimicrobia bacterium]|nr:hypothetical protein [Candidatus Neomarinimicrobiota bacterium]HRU93030.1 hypothetical protein [Candidatus Neomarinimicrobiota bacterium]
MDTLTIELTAAIVRNPATPSGRTKVEITIENSVGHLSVENFEGSPRSVHRFTVRDAADLGCGGVQNLTAEQASFILAISCSLTNPRILFSPFQTNYLPASLKLGEVPSKFEDFDTPTSKHITITETMHIEDSFSTLYITKLSLDEAQVLNVANRLLTARIFDTTNRSLLELNVLESIKRYREALMSSNGLSFYKSLYNAFEKAVNADTDRKGKTFDATASALTGLTQADIQSLRLFNNRVKHPLRNKKDFAELRDGEAHLSQLAFNLKRVADSAILSRI